ncbi:MAG TPA: ATP-binding protein [Pseudonocardia sp.]|nr:ATP-binding protein [Pseudonocardia sp.]
MSEHGSSTISAVEEDIEQVYASPSHRVQPRLRLLLEAEPSALAFLRHETIHWLRQLRWPETPITDAVIALNAAVSNCVQHAYGEPGGYISVHGLAASHGSDSAARFTVRDWGHWKIRDPSRRCFGMALMGELTEEFFIETSKDGTVIILTTPVVATS